MSTKILIRARQQIIQMCSSKFLVDREGKVLARFEPTVDMQEVRAAVEAALKA